MSDTLNLQSASEYLNIGESTLQELVARGEVPGAKVGKSWVFHKDMMSDWLRAETIKQTENRKQARAASSIEVIEKASKPGRRRNGIPKLPTIAS